MAENEAEAAPGQSYSTDPNTFTEDHSGLSAHHLNDQTEETVYDANIAREDAVGQPAIEDGDGTGAIGGDARMAAPEVDGDLDEDGNEAEGDSQAQSEVDRRSVHVGNVEYSSTPEQLQEHFKTCGPINRITIMVDKYTGHPKGFAYIEFAEESSVAPALSLSGSEFNGRPLKVSTKRTNIPGYNRVQRGGRGLYGRGAFGLGPLAAQPLAAALMMLRGGFMPRKPRGRGLIPRGPANGHAGYHPRHRGRATAAKAAPY